MNVTKSVEGEASGASHVTIVGGAQGTNVSTSGGSAVE